MQKIKNFLLQVLHILVIIRDGLIGAFAALFGDWYWSKPAWLRALTGAVRRLKEALLLKIRTQPRASAVVAVAVALLLGGGYAAWRWYQNLPKPVEIEFTVQAPVRTCYECNPAGTPNPLIVNFSGSVAKLEAAGKPITGAHPGLSISPEVAGQWSWGDDKTLRFQPQQDWPIAEKYTVEFKKKGFVADQIRLKDYSFDFETPVFTAKIANTEFYQDPVKASEKHVVVTVNFSHAVDPVEFEQRIALTLFNKISDSSEEKVDPAPKFTVVYDKLKLNAFIHSEPLNVPAKQGRAQVEIDKGLRAARGGNKTEEPMKASVDVPGLYSLKVNTLKLDIVRDEKDEPSQVMMLETTYSVLEKEITGKVTAMLLPLKNPDPKLQASWERYNKNKPYLWSNSTVTPQVLAQAEKLPIEYVPNEREHVELHSFRYKADPGRSLYIKVDKGLRSFGGYLMADTVERVLDVPQYPKELRIASKGSLLAMSGSHKLTVFTRGDIPALRVQVGRLLPNQIQHLVTQFGGDFSKPSNQSWNFDVSNITERRTKIIRLPKSPPGTAHYEPVDLGEFLAKDGADRRGIFLLKIEAYDSDKDQAVSQDESNSEQSDNSDDGGGYSSYDAQLNDTRMVVLTDLGLIVKKAVNGSQDTFVQSIATGEPLAGVTVDVIGKNGEPVLSQTTDAGGRAQFVDLKSFKNEKAPALYLARRGGDSSFIPVGSRVRGLDLSRFDVGGVANSPDKNRLGAYVFSDRGIYRPGDEIRTGLIIKSQDWSKPLKGVPLVVEVTDPRGQTVKRESIALSAVGFEEFRFGTRETSPTGDYSINVYIPREDDRRDLIGSLQVKVQEFQPDRLKMAAHLSSEVSEGWVSPDALKATVSLQNLFGTPAENRRVTARITLSPSLLSFSRYSDYEFVDPQAAKEGFDNALADGKTDEKGEATFDLNLQRFARATYRLHLITEGFEPDGGRGVTAEAAQLVSSLPYLIGFKADGDLGYVSRGTKRAVHLLAINPKAQPTAVQGLTLTRIERKYVSMLLKQENGTYKYESRVKEVKLDEKPYVLGAKGESLVLDTVTPGNFAYVVSDKDGQSFTRIEYSVAGTANLTRSLEKNAELQITLNRKDYAAGDEIEMQIQAPYTGSGLITIERDKVYAYRWFKTSTTSSMQKIRVPDDLEGNAYVSVSFVRDPGSDEIYMSPLSYGVQPFSIALDQRKNKITLNATEKVKPGEVLKLRYKTEKPARIVLFAVDEGILQVARYTTPDPLGHFFEKRSLDVDTRQILDLILPEFRQLGMAAPGGDGEAALGRHLNPFKRKTDKPVAWWSGVVDADSTERELSYTVPDYFNGSLRLMAVAVSRNDIGVAEGKSLVRGDFVLSPNAPTTVTPGDEFDVSVGVSNNAEGSGKDAPVTVGVEPSLHLQVIGDKSKTVKISEMHESVVHFKVRTLDALGSASLQFNAAWKNKSARLGATMSVRPATPYMTQLSAGHFKAGRQDVNVTRNLYPQFRKQTAGISVLPLGLAHGLNSYLGDYPYSCTEQLVSQAMPAIVLSTRPEFGYVKAAPGADLQGLIDELRSRQSPDGGYRYWAGISKVEEFVSIYVQHVLLEAMDHGQSVPRDLISNGNAYLRSIARRDGNNLDDERDAAYAIYLLTRQGNVMANEAGALQKRLQERYADKWPGDITAAWLAASYKLMKQDSLADKAIAKVKLGGSHATSKWHNGMTSDAELLYVLAKHFPERLPKLPTDFLDLLVKRMQGGEYNSLSAATTVLALDAYAKTAGAAAAGKLGISEILRDGKTVRDLILPAGVLPTLDFSADASKLRFSNAAELPAYWLMNQSGFDRKPPTTAIKNGFEIIREYTDADGKVLSSVKLGQEVDVHIKFRAINRDAINDAVLVDLLPGGFELVMPPAAPTAQPHLEAAYSEDEGESGNEGDVEQEQGCTCAFLLYRPQGFPDYAEMREDRMIVYGQVNGDIQEFRYHIKATNIGSYVVPPAYGESMYERQVQARSVAGRITVEAP